MWTPELFEAPIDPDRSKRSHAVCIVEQFEKYNRHSKSWARRMIFTYDGVDYPFVLEAINMADEAAARDKLFSEGATDAARKMFLTEVKLEVQH